MLPALRPHQAENLEELRAEVRDRLEMYIMRVTESGCWIWMGHLNQKGYGQFRGEGAHRTTYKIYHGPIQEGLQLDHICRVRCCVNPHHLESVTLQVNVARGEVVITNRSKTHCANGHEYSPENTGHYKNERYCKVCRAADKKKYRAQRSR